ncbi:MAG: 2-dehydropantoate 2-reductase [Planctomycetota bacterium]
MLKNIGIIGVGGVGGYFGGKLCQSIRSRDDQQVIFVARGKHLRQIQSSGLRLVSEEGDFRCVPSIATDDFSSLPPLDMCLICVKDFDLPGVLNSIRPAVTPDTVLLPLLNGVDVDVRVRQAIPTSVVLPACVYVGTHVREPGTVVQNGGACKILFGPDPQRPDFDLQPIQRLLGQASIRFEFRRDVQSEVWTKFIFICSFGLVSAAHDKTLGEILSNEVLLGQVEQVMHEAATVAFRSGVHLPTDVIESSLGKALTFPPTTKTSFQRDFENGTKPDERELFAGALIRLGRNLNVEVPRTQAILDALSDQKPFPNPSDA